MSSRLDDLIALLGLACLLSGIYLWVGLPPMLILLGIILIYIGARYQPRGGTHEPDQTANTTTTT